MKRIKMVLMSLLACMTLGSCGGCNGCGGKEQSSKKLDAYEITVLNESGRMLETGMIQLYTFDDEGNLDTAYQFEMVIDGKATYKVPEASKYLIRVYDENGFEIETTADYVTPEKYSSVKVEIASE